MGVDGSCGTNTINAIQAFQLKHFGWSGADGRVDPNGQTLAKLNTFEKTSPPPPPPPKPALPTSTNFFLIHMSAKTISNGNPLDLFFLISDLTNSRLAVYHLSGSSAPSMVPTSNSWSGSGGKFTTKKARRIDDLAAPTVWFSNQSGGTRTSKLVIGFPEGGVTIPMNHHLIGPGGMMNGDGGVSYPGKFKLIELR